MIPLTFEWMYFSPLGTTYPYVLGVLFVQQTNLLLLLSSRLHCKQESIHSFIHPLNAKVGSLYIQRNAHWYKSVTSKLLFTRLQFLTRWKNRCWLRSHFALRLNLFTAFVRFYTACKICATDFRVVFMSHAIFMSHWFFTGSKIEIEIITSVFRTVFFVEVQQALIMNQHFWRIQVEFKAL